MRRMAQGGRRKAVRPDGGSNTRTPLLLALVAAVAAAVTVTALVLGPGAGQEAAAPRVPAASSPSPSRSTAPLGLSHLPVARILMCDALDDDSLVTALEGPVTTRDSYTNGDRVEIVPGVEDVAHEDSCRFGSGDAEAQVWVFAAPVGTTEARRLVRETRAVRGCTFPGNVTGFGSPGVAGVCTVRRPGRSGSQEATFRGLFGDAWLSCRLSTAAGEQPDVVLQRTDRWCVHVATTLGARP